ncbi:MarR family winged helix-turn-helix transcriptional regulator [Paenibacillus sp. N3.4]|uniref:MarR family winged helix-turn-helix transcriptional regulator n=1 Tax=Paenibacillus sp. N3.4 TaxID=2603222 RepID=UPI0011CBEE0E|nr:MarR family transcriptional regulator [Paenibacillus sp. N3.4]TXK77106.1 MarR family transcriptional regulator [Paenibacillus sp. N3.4]
MTDSSDSSFLVQELARTFGQLARSSNKSRSFKGLRQSEFTLLTTVSYYTGANAEGIKISELSRSLDVTPAGATHLVDALEEIGYLERLSDPNDRRIVLVRTTAKGEEQIKETEAHFFHVFKELAEHLGEQDAKELIRLLRASLGFLREVEVVGVIRGNGSNFCGSHSSSRCYSG